MTRSSHKRQVPLSTWAKREGINLRTAQRMAQRGDLPVPHRVTDKGRIMVFIEEQAPQLTPEETSEMLFAIKNQLNQIQSQLDRIESRLP